MICVKCTAFCDLRVRLARVLLLLLLCCCCSVVAVAVAVVAVAVVVVAVVRFSLLLPLVGATSIHYFASCDIPLCFVFRAMTFQNNISSHSLCRLCWQVETQLSLCC